jgi:hypothetical protein
MGEENIYDIFGEMSSKGLSDESLEKLPRHEITNEKRGSIHGEDLSCNICLQASKKLLRKNPSQYTCAAFCSK